MTRDIIRFHGSCVKKNKLLLGNLRTNRERVILPSSQSKIKKKILSSLTNQLSEILALYVLSICKELCNLEFSRPHWCLYQAMQTRKTFSIALTYGV